MSYKLFCSHARDPERYGWKVFGNFMLIKDSKKVKRGGRRERRGGGEEKKQKEKKI